MSPTDSTEIAIILRRCLDTLEPLRLLLPTWHEKFQTLLTEGAAERLRIGVVGVTSSGKSTFINALLGEQILPEQSKATTNLPVLCRKGPARMLKVLFPDSQPKTYTDADVTADLLKSLCSEDGNPGNAKNILRIELEMPTCCLHENLEIIDTPGTDAYGFADHETITLYRCLPISDIIVFMTHIRKAGLTVSDAQLLQRVIENDQRVLFIISSSDNIAEEYQDGRLFRSRREKLNNCVAALAKSIADFPSLKQSGIAAVSSLWAKIAAGDRTRSEWRDSNFDVVLNLFESYAADLEAILAASRVARTKANIEALRVAVHAQCPELKNKSAQTSREDELAAKVSRFATTERSLRRRLSVLRKAVILAMNPAELMAEAVADLATVYPSNLSGLRSAMTLIESHRQGATESLWAMLDDVRAACRRDLESLGLSPGREAFRKRLLHLDAFPSLSKSIVEHTETYEVTVPRSYFGGKLADWFFGVRTERRSRTTSTVDMAALRRSLEVFLTTSTEEFLALIDEQIQMFGELYIDPIHNVWEVDAKCLEEIRAFRLLAGEQAQKIPEIVRMLHQLEKNPIFISRPEREFTQSHWSIPDRATGSMPEPHANTSLNPAYAALYEVLSRAWESVAIRSFWEFAAQAAGSGQQLASLLWVGQEALRFNELVSYLTRNMKNAGDGFTTKQPVRTFTLTLETGTTEIVCSSADCADSLAGFGERCAQASAIAVDFDATQPSSGLNRLLGDPRFKILEIYASKIFFVFMDGAVFNTRLQELVVDVIPLATKATGFTASPWFVCESVRYDARYSDFIRLSCRVLREGGGARQLIRIWRDERLSMLPPFQATSLEQAFTAVLSKGVIT